MAISHSVSAMNSVKTDWQSISMDSMQIADAFPENLGILLGLKHPLLLKNNYSCEYNGPPPTVLHLSDSENLVR